MNKNLYIIAGCNGAGKTTASFTVDYVLIFDNSGGKPILLADKILKTELNIVNEEKFNKLKKYYNERT